jgi:hypothetical protein
MRSAEEFDKVQLMIATGMNDCEIAREAGIPRKTVWEWRHGPRVRTRDRAGTSVCGIEHDFTALRAAPYCYLLDMYLGDGCISRHPRSWHLRITCDTQYPAIIRRCREAINMVMPNQSAAIVQRPERCVDVSHFSKHWPCLLPQHGPGRKHHRRIALAPWQQALVYQATEEFVCGLIHSDGCRVVANDRGVRSIRYHFSNRSEDIIGLFTAALDHLEIPWTRSTKYIVSIYRKAATARMDEFIGPKAIAVPWSNVHYTA